MRLRECGCAQTKQIHNVFFFVLLFLCIKWKKIISNWFQCVWSDELDVDIALTARMRWQSRRHIVWNFPLPQRSLCCCSKMSRVMNVMSNAPQSHQSTCIGFTFISKWNEWLCAYDITNIDSIHFVVACGAVMMNHFVFPPIDRSQMQWSCLLLSCIASCFWLEFRWTNFGSCVCVSQIGELFFFMCFCFAIFIVRDPIRNICTFFSWLLLVGSHQCLCKSIRASRVMTVRCFGPNITEQCLVCRCVLIIFRFFG